MDVILIFSCLVFVLFEKIWFIKSCHFPNHGILIEKTKFVRLVIYCAAFGNYWILRISVNFLCQKLSFHATTLDLVIFDRPSFSVIIFDLSIFDILSLIFYLWYSIFSLQLLQTWLSMIGHLLVSLFFG